MDMEKKPLIFIYPISETVQKLKETFTENEAAEIYEVDVLTEAVQLFQTTAPAVVMCSDAKKMLQFQAMNKRVVAKTSSKTILCTEKKLNIRAERKFSQLGLSDYIKEPIAGKTLYYKINLLIKSLPKRKTAEDENYNVKEGNYQEEDAGEEMNLKTKSKNSEESETLDNYLRASIKKKDDVELDMGEGIVQKGKDSSVDNSDMSGNSNYKEDELGGYYEGDGEGEMQDLAGSMASKDSQKENANIEDLAGKLKESVTEKEQDLTSEISTTDKNIGGDLIAKSEKGLNLEDEDTGKDLPTDDFGDIDLQEEAKLAMLEVEDEGPSLKESKNLNSPEEVDNNKSTNLDLIQEEMEFHERKKQLQELEEEEHSKGVNLQVEEEEQDLPNLKQLKAPEEEEENKTTNLDLIEDEIEFQERKKQLEEADEEEKARNAFEENLGSGNNSGKGQTDNIDSQDMKGRNSQEAPQEDIKGNLGRAQEIDNSAMKGSIEREVQTEQDSKERTFEENPEMEREGHEKDLEIKEELGAKKEPKQLDNELEESEEDKRAKNKADDIDQYMRSPNLKKEKLEDSDNGMNMFSNDEEEKGKINQRELEERGFEDNWDINKDENHNYDDGFAPKNNMKVVAAEDEDLGEQTIDYKKIKKAYAEGSSGDDAFSEENHYRADKKPYTFEVAEKAPHTFEVEEDPQYSLSEETEEDQEEKKGTTIYTPDSKGIEFLVNRLIDYRDNGKGEFDIFFQIANTLKKEQKGLVTFYINRGGQDPSTDPTLETWFSMHELIADEDPDALEQWIRMKEENYNDCLKAKFPKWKDHTFQEAENIFVFPFYEGIQYHGMGIVTFNTPKSEKNTDFIEIQMESARGLYLEQFEEKMSLAKTNHDTNEEEIQEKEEKGFFSRIFRKAS